MSKNTTLETMKPRQSEKLEKDVNRLLHADPQPAQLPKTPSYYTDKRPAIIATLLVVCIAAAIGTWLLFKYLHAANTPVQPASIIPRTRLD